MKKYKFFWHGIFSNWHESPFHISGRKFNCGEQYMMYAKASVFLDYDTTKKILKTKNPKEQKKLGRQVKNYDERVWASRRYELVKRGLRQKFLQNPELKEELLKFHGYEMVEASPYDRIWGIGYKESDALDNIDKWGENLLGKMLTELSNEIKQIKTR